MWLVWSAGQALVQFATAAPHGREFAVKFFLDRSAFYSEAALYAAYFPHVRKLLKHAPPIAPGTNKWRAAEGTSNDSARIEGGRFLPHVEALCDSAQAGLVDPSKEPLPPCIVMERGESLQDWSDRAEPDRFTSFSVRTAAPPCACMPYVWRSTL